MTEAKSPEQSRTQMTELVLPQHANAVGTAFGGSIMGWVDICAAITAQRHCGRVAVTARVDALEFVAPIRVGDVVSLSGQLNAVFRTSMEVGVRVEREDRASGARVLCVEATLTFVQLDEQGRPLEVPRLVLDSEEARARDAAARQRRKARQQG